MEINHQNIFVILFWIKWGSACKITFNNHCSIVYSTEKLMKQERQNRSRFVNLKSWFVKAAGLDGWLWEGQAACHTNILSVRNLKYDPLFSNYLLCLYYVPESMLRGCHSLLKNPHNWLSKYKHYLALKKRKEKKRERKRKGRHGEVKNKCISKFREIPSLGSLDR